ncbi:MAG: hypothetical protein ACXQT4_05960 [Methanotrichaceae archaeon]
MRFSRISWFVITLIVIVTSAQAQEVVDLYSDLQSCDVTVDGNMSNCVLQVDLSSSDGSIQTKTLSLEGTSTWIVEWDVPKAEEGSYCACARLLKEGNILSERCFNFYYGEPVSLRFDVRDFNADHNGMHLLIYSRDLAVVDIYYMLIRGNKALYVSKETSVPISNNVMSPTHLSRDWKQILENNAEYQGRIKIVETKNNQTRVFMNSFIAKDDAEITDTYEDETGASATVVGKSRVPFEGSLRFELSQNRKFITSVEKKTPVLLTGDDETVEISWNNTLDPGIYQLKILLLGNDGDVIDFEESIIEAEIPSRPLSVEKVEEKSSMTLPIVGVVLITLISAALVLIARRRKN